MKAWTARGEHARVADVQKEITALVHVQNLFDQDADSITDLCTMIQDAHKLQDGETLHPEDYDFDHNGDNGDFEPELDTSTDTFDEDCEQQSDPEIEQNTNQAWPKV